MKPPTPKWKILPNGIENALKKVESGKATGKDNAKTETIKAAETL